MRIVEWATKEVVVGRERKREREREQIRCKGRGHFDRTRIAKCVCVCVTFCSAECPNTSGGSFGEFKQQRWCYSRCALRGARRASAWARNPAHVRRSDRRQRRRTTLKTQSRRTCGRETRVGPSSAKLLSRVETTTGCPRAIYSG